MYGIPHTTLLYDAGVISYSYRVLKNLNFMPLCIYVLKSATD